MQRITNSRLCSTPRGIPTHVQGRNIYIISYSYGVISSEWLNEVCKRDFHILIGPTDYMRVKIHACVWMQCV